MAGLSPAIAEEDDPASTHGGGPRVDTDSERNDHPTRQETVLIWAHDPDRRSRIVDLIAAADWLPLVARSREDAVRILTDAPPDLFLLAIDETSGDDMMLIDQARAAPEGQLKRFNLQSMTV